MAKQLNQEARVNLTFSANASQAKSQIIELQGLLNKIALGTDLKINPQQAKEAATAAKELSMHLNNAYNATTGNFDLSKLSRSLNSAKTDVTQLSQKLLDAGTTGQQAFVKLAQTVAAADRPMITINARLKEMWITMKNTAKWQISSSVLHGFIGALQTAYGYSQDLNESLNNIRIVTGQSIDQMARFAEQANKAAKALSATTTEYTDAALIYYQQGLNDKEVAERTEATVKLANVSGQTAEQVSDQLTAVWNNFDNGTKSLEYYVDVMAALGAATASSTEEISQGLEKFAAVAETVGLSYEYATAALATVTATTRQSADVVGTAFKTLFARIQDLELGETLEDGVSLGKYSEALKAIGVDILDVNGNVRQMNDILNDMGEKWNTISKAQQISVAQTVAGVRQYTQLVALMDNWDYFQENLGVAAGSEGELTRQAEIYEESWAAAQKRVKASAEQIYSDLLDDEFFIDITDGFSGLLDSVDAFIDGIGGVGPLIGGISSILIGAFSGKVVESLNNLKNNLLVTFKGAGKQADALATAMNKTVVAKLKESDEAAVGSANKLNDSMRQSLEGTLSLNKAKATLATVQDKLTASEAQGAEIEMNMIKQYEQEAQAIAQTITQLKDKNQLLMSQGSLFSNNSETEKMDSGYLVKHGKAAADRMHASLEHGDSAIQGFLEALMAVDNKTDQVQININELYGDFSKASQTFQNIFTRRVSANDTNSAPFLEWKQQALDFVNVIEQAGGAAIPSLEKAINKIKGSKSAGAMATGFEDLLKVLNSTKAKTLDIEAVLKRLSKMKGPGAEVAKNLQAIRAKTDDLTQANNKLNKAVKEFNPTHTVTGLERITAAAAGLGQVAMAAMSLRSIFQAWNNDDLSFGEKLTTTFMSLSMIIPSVIGVYNQFNKVLGINIAQGVIALIQKKQLIATVMTEARAKAIVNKHDHEKAKLTALMIYLQKEYNIENKEEAKDLAAQILAKMGVIKTSGKSVKTKLKEIWATKLSTAATDADTTRTIANKLAKLGLIGVIVAATAAVVALTVALIANANGEKRLKEEAKTAAEALQALSERYKEAQEKAEAFKSAISEYDDGINAIKELTEGTTEYVNAIEDANKKTLELIETYGMFNDWDYGKDGLIELNPDAIQRMQEQLNQTTNQAQMEKYVGEINSGELAIESARRALIDSGATSYVDVDAAQSGGQGLARLSTNEIDTIANIISANEGRRPEQIIKVIEDTKGISDNILDALYLVNTKFDDWQTYSKTRDSKNEAIEYYNQKLLEGAFAATGRYNDNKDLQLTAANLYNVKDVMDETIDGLNNFNRGNRTVSDDIVSDSSGRKRRRFIRNYYDKQGEDLRGGMGDRQLAELYAEKVLGLEKGSYDYKKGKGEGTIVDFNGKEYTLTDNQMEYELAAQIVSEKLQKELQDKNAPDEAKQIDKFVESLNNLDSNTMEVVSNAFANWDGEGTPLDIDWAAISPAEMEQLKAQYGKFGTELGDEYSKALMESANAFWTEEAYSARLEEIQKAQIQSQVSVNELDESAIKLQTELIQENNDALQSNNQLLEENENAAMQLAVNNARMNQGLASLIDNWEDLSSVLHSNDKTTTEYAETLAELQTIFGDLLGLTNNLEKNLSAEFLGSAETLSLLEQAAQGSTKAITQLGFNAAKELANSFEISTDFLTAKTGEIGATTEEEADAIVSNYTALFQREQQELTSFIDQISNAIANQNFTLAGIDMDGFAQSLNAMAEMTGMTVEDMQGMLNSMGLEANIETKEVQFKSKVPVYRTVTIPDPNDKNAVESYTYQVRSEEVNETRSVAAIAYGSGNKPKINYVGHGNISAGNSSSISSAKSGRSEKKNATRYKYSDDRSKTSERRTNNLEAKLDTATGPARQEILEQIAGESAKELENLKRAAQIGQRYIREDLTTLVDTGKKYGIDFAVDENGNLTQDSINQLDALYAEYAETGSEALGQQIDEIESALSQYEDTRDDALDRADAVLEKQRENWDNNYRLFSERLEFDLELSERSIKNLERQISKLADDVFARAELTADQNNPYLKMYSQLNGDMTNLAASKAELDALYYGEFDEQGKLIEGTDNRISPEQYKAGLLELEAAAENGIDAYNELKDTMSTYYADTLSMIDDIYSSFMDLATDTIDIMDHYNNILDLTGGEHDYEAKAVILEGQAASQQQIVNTRKEYYDMMQAEATERKDAMDTYLANGGSKDDEVYKQYRDEWMAAQQYANQAHSDLLSSVEDWASAVNAVLENEIAAAAAELEKALTNGSSFDELNTSMERTRSLQEEWLDSTNQMYETTKMMRTAQTAMDKTSNQAAKAKLKTFMEQTKQLQDQKKLSSFELEVQQARYDLLLAEIALEEAQNAKSTVRLQRDSEGNFGYVYTADQDKVAEVQQAYDDAENKLYNLSVEGINTYNEKYFQLRQEMFEALTAIANDHSLSEEERMQKMAETEAYYGQMMADASYLRNIAATAQSYELMDEFKQGYTAQQQGLVDELAAIDAAYQNGSIASEAEYETEIANAKIKHYGNLEGYSNGYYGDLVLHAEGYAQKMGLSNTESPLNTVNNAWSSSFIKQEGYAKNWKEKLFGTDGKSGIMGTAQTEWANIMSGNKTAAADWMEALVGKNGDGSGGYVGSIKSAFSTYRTEMEEINEAVGLSMHGSPDGSDTASKAELLAEIIGNTDQEGLRGVVTNLTDELGDQNSGLIKGFKDSAQGAKNTSDAFKDKLIPETNNLETAFETLWEDIQTAIGEIDKLNLKTLNDKSATYTITYEYKTNNNNNNNNGGRTGGLNKDFQEETLWEDGTVKNSDLIGGTGLTEDMVIIPTPQTMHTAESSEWWKKGTGLWMQYNGTKIIDDISYHPIIDDSGNLTGKYVKSTNLEHEDIGIASIGNGDQYWCQNDRDINLPLYEYYNTGGYTGEWGPAGKLAVLHEKELILNAHDTENMLMMISMVRDMMSLIDIPSLASNMISPLMGTIGTTPLEQSVHIEASFPGVSDRNEIEEAFNNLINTASQYINRKTV